MASIYFCGKSPHIWSWRELEVHLINVPIVVAQIPWQNWWVLSKIELLLVDILHNFFSDIRRGWSAIIFVKIGGWSHKRTGGPNNKPFKYIARVEHILDDVRRLMRLFMADADNAAEHIQARRDGFSLQRSMKNLVTCFESQGQNALKFNSTNMP